MVNFQNKSMTLRKNTAIEKCNHIHVHYIKSEFYKCGSNDESILILINLDKKNDLKLEAIPLISPTLMNLAVYVCVCVLA